MTDTQEKSSTYQELAPPLIAFGTCAMWEINGIRFWQFSPAIADPYTDVVPFLRQAFQVAAQPGGSWNFKTPGYSSVLPAKTIEPWMTIPGSDPLVKLLFQHWPEISTIPPKRNAKIAYEWRLWRDDNGEYEASFRRYDAEGQVVPLHDIPRKPFEEMVADLGTSSELEALTKWM